MSSNAGSERTEYTLTQNQLHELLETDQAKALVEGAEERGYVEPTELEAFALELDLNDQDIEELTRELERIGLDVGAPAAGAKAAASAKKKDADDDDDAPAPAPVAAASGAADSLQLFLADVGRHKLLTAAEEVMLAKRIERGREPTKEELAEATGLPMQHIDEALGAAHASVSLNQTVGADDEGELGDLFADREAADPFEEAEESLRRQGVRRALDALPERERRILELRFGFEGEPWTLEAIGHELDLTRERVRQLEGQALARLAALRELQTVAA